MAAATVNGTPIVDVWGRTPVIVVDVTWGDSDTYTSPDIGNLEAAQFVPTTNASCGVTVSANVATLHSGGSLTGKLFLYGSGE